MASFPSQDPFHAGCKTETVVQLDCASTYAHLDKTIKSYANGGPSHGIYKFVEEVDDKYLWMTRTTPTKHYVDDIEFTLTPGTGPASGFNTTGETCSIKA